MPTETWPRSARLNLVFEHLDAVREVSAFLRSDEYIAEIKALRRIVERELTRAVFEPAGWGTPYWVQDEVFCAPRGARWKVCKGVQNSVSVVICLPEPVHPDPKYDPYHPFVGLYAPSQWKALTRFTKHLRTNLPTGFDHIAKHPNEGFLAEQPIWKYIPYARFVKVDSGFDTAVFLRAMTDAARKLVAMERKIYEWIRV